MPAGSTLNTTGKSTDVPFRPVMTNVTVLSPAFLAVPIILPDSSTSPDGSVEPLFSLYCMSVP